MPLLNDVDLAVVKRPRPPRPVRGLVRLNDAERLPAGEVDHRHALEGAGARVVAPGMVEGRPFRARGLEEDVFDRLKLGRPGHEIVDHRSVAVVREADDPLGKHDDPQGGHASEQDDGGGDPVEARSAHPERGDLVVVGHPADPEDGRQQHGHRRAERDESRHLVDEELERDRKRHPLGDGEPRQIEHMVHYEQGAEEGQRKSNGDADLRGEQAVEQREPHSRNPSPRYRRRASALFSSSPGLPLNRIRPSWMISTRSVMAIVSRTLWSVITMPSPRSRR